MAFKGTAGKSASGASMSKYDVEVEDRLQKLEAAVAALQTHSHDSSGGSDARVDKIISHLAKNEDISDILGA
tara:strand:- start:317 stop:532 length:216 start_codon:yes stop_codon:yes gene_type:complete